MTMVSNAIINRIQIYFYSILIAFMSGINRFRAYLDPYVDVPVQPSTTDFLDITKAMDDVPERPLVVYWTYLSQVLLRLSIWIVLGFAAGYLLGMVNPR